jgi:hypothetical protein
MARGQRTVKILDWLAGHFSTRRRALSLYRRGRARARKHDRQGAINDYTTTIAMRGTPDEVKALALFYRALVHVAAGDEPKGVADFKRILAMDEGLVNVKTMARQRLAGLTSQSGGKHP